MLLSLLKTESTFFFEPRSSSHKTEVASPWFDFVDTHVSGAYWRVILSILTVFWLFADVERNEVGYDYGDVVRAARRKRQVDQSLTGILRGI